MRERVLSPEEIRILLGAEKPRRRWSWKRAAHNLCVVVATAGVIMVLTQLALAAIGAVRVV